MKNESDATFWVQTMENEAFEIPVFIDARNDRVEMLLVQVSLYSRKISPKYTSASRFLKLIYVSRQLKENSE